MNTVSTAIRGVLFAFSVAACSSEQAPNPQPGGSAGTSSSSGGSPVSNTGGSPVSTGGAPGNSGGSLAGGSSGTSSNTGGSAASNPGGGSSGNAAGAGGTPSDVGGQAGTSGGPAGGGAGTNAGGDAGGAGKGTAPAVTAFVTSGPDAYLKTDGQVTVLTSGTADLSVDEETKYQRWDGFGGTFNEMGWDALSVVSAEIPTAIKLLFDPVDGANFVFGRIPLGASDYAMSWYTLAETANDYEMENFSIERDREMLIPYIQAALEVQPALRLWASPWVVPSWMMEGRTMKSDPQTLEAHALYFAKFVEEYGKEGLEIEMVQHQNEPGYARVGWTQALFIDFIKTYLGPKFEERGLTAEIWCGTMSHPNDGTIATTLANDADAMKYTKGFGLQWNLQSTVALLAPKGPVMQTEHKCGNYNFETPYWDQSRYSRDKPQNDHLYGEESWQLLRDWIVAGVNSYSAWNMVLDTVGKSLDGWPQNALLVVDRAAQKLIATPAYYAFRHYSQYIRPGATRIAITGSNDAVAFQNADGSVVTQVYNSGDAPKTTTVGVRAGFYQFDVPAHGWATLAVTP